MNYRTLSDMALLIRRNLHKIPRLPVVGIPRSGLIAASQIATHLNLPMYDLYDPKLNDYPNPLLLVDDSISGGETIAHIKACRPNVKWITLVVFRKPSSPPVDIAFETLPGPRIFEQNWHRHPLTKYAVFDIDGVICDETETERITNWDDLNHVRAVREAAGPKFLPRRKVLAIATGRREVEREFTEAWLAKHGVQYEHIFFSTEERGAKRTKLHAVQQTKAKWVIESDERQALWLKMATGLPVLCTDLNTMF